MFGSDSKPTRIYSYGARRVVLDEQYLFIDQQMFRAHQYRNALVEVELARREKCDAAMLAHFPDLATLAQNIENLKAQISQMENQVKIANAIAHRRTGTPEQRNALSTLRKSLKEVGAQYKAMRDACWHDEVLQTALTGFNDEADTAMNTLYNITFHDVYWCTRGAVREAMMKVRKGPPPKFKKWNKDGKIALQIGKGMSVEEAFLCNHNMLRLHMQAHHNGTIVNRKGVTRTNLPVPSPTSKRSQKYQHGIVDFCVGSDGKNQPRFVQIPFLLSRPLPSDARIKRVYLIRRKVATHFKWNLQFVIERKEGFPVGVEGDNYASIDVGWRLLENNDLRIASWVGSDGNKGELTLPAKDVARWLLPTNLRSIRDRNFNIIKETLSEYRDGHDLPEWLTEALQYLPQWHSQARLASVVIRWRINRFPGDEEIYTTLQAWRKQDKHLYDWQEFHRRRAINWRNNLYTNFVNGPDGLGKKYNTIVIEDTDWREVRLCPLPEDENGNDRLKRYRDVSSVGKFLSIVKAGFAKVVEKPAEWTTQRCHACGEYEPFNAANELIHTCSHCKEEWDQDENAALVLMQLFTGALEPF